MSSPEPLRLLIVEVSDSTLAYHRETKGSLYARARVPEYWILNLLESTVEVLREPHVSPGTRFGWHYRVSERRQSLDTIALLSHPGVRVPIADLLP